jgi:hypothetical protein
LFPNGVFEKPLFGADPDRTIIELAGGSHLQSHNFYKWPPSALEMLVSERKMEVESKMKALSAASSALSTTSSFHPTA